MRWLQTIWWMAVCQAAMFPYSDSVQIAFDVHGTGEIPIVLLHSMGGSKELFDPLLPDLLAACDCRIYRLDLKGHGDSSAPDDHDYSLETNSAVVRSFLKHSNLRGVVLIGHSYGGAVALNVALDSEPGTLSRLVLISSPGVAQKFPFLVSHHRYEGYGKVIDRITTPKFRAWVAVHAHNTSNAPGVKHRVAVYSRLWSNPARSRAARETARQFLDNGGLKALAARDHDTHVPTLVIAGDRDRIVGLRRMRELADGIPGSKLVIIPGAGHSPQEDMPQLVMPKIADFIHAAQPVSDSAPPRVALR